MVKTAGIIIIGDEILSGKIQDSNSHFMVKELRLHGIDVRRISVIPDDVKEIANEVREFSERFDYVFTSGGIGPTHDDVTIEGIAKAFDVKITLNKVIKKFLYKRFGKHLTSEQLKIAKVPEGAELIKNGTVKFPIILFRNVYILPGIPEFLEKKFFVIEKLFDEPPFLLKKIYIKEYEPEIAPYLNQMVKRHKDVKIGSYPVVGNRDYYVMVTLESKDDKSLNLALNDILQKIPRRKVFKVEG
ncbi:MAG: competence/damage-inducible protein A [Nitrospirae bacterium]|nr:competence/damage-inducible protein A [Nitrospirota bacterium]